MKNHSEKPSPEAKALSLFLMAHKSIKPIYKQKAKRINKQWDLLKIGKISKDAYVEEVRSMLSLFGGYEEVVKKTVQFYIEKTGEWKLKGSDKYCLDAQNIANELVKK